MMYVRALAGLSTEQSLARQRRAMLETMSSTQTAQDRSAALLAADYAVLRQGCGLVDVSERGKLALTGSSAVQFLTHKGKMLGDLRILALAGEDGQAVAELVLDTERVALQALFDMIRRFKVGFLLELHKRTLERGLLSLIGPQAETIAGAERLAAGEHANGQLKVGGVEALAIRTEQGIDLLCEAADTEPLCAALLARGATAVAPEAAECLRVERGRPRYGVDMDDTTIPQEAGLNERAVSFTKGCYVGQETVARLHYRGKPNRHLRGLRLSAPAETGEQLRLGEREVGRLGSSVVSPELGPIALALVRREGPPGATVLVGDGGTPAEVLELPFR
jgi:tRNA-modifying protein YgfZ